jgi:hypothetical protein
MGKKKTQIHSSIKQRLGYAGDISDKEFLKDWRKRSSQVCKPCWELKYCPYGPFVEHSPLLPPLRKDVKEDITSLKKSLETGIMHKREPLDDETREFYTQLLAEAKKDLRILANFLEPKWRFSKLVETVSDSEDPIQEVLRYEPGAIERHSVPFPLDFDTEEKVIPAQELDPELIELARKEVERMKEALETGIDEHIEKLTENVRKSFGRRVSSFREEDYPENMPEEIQIMECNIFGHICPVVFVGEAVTESSELRRKGRYIPFKTKIRVVRRDNYTCQHCGKHLQDDEVEFDHIIPIARGGSSEEHNIRLTCFPCNRDKSDSIEI